MFKCLKEFYSNNYSIIIIESKNRGGYSELCVPMTQYIRPKILDTVQNSQKHTQLNYDYFITGDETMRKEICIPYSNMESLNRNKVDIYTNENGNITHNRTKEYEMYSIYSKKYMEERREYIATNHTKKPTEIIVFTDGLTFSCGSVFVKGLQVYGSAIIVGYNTFPNLTKDEFDASQSNSAVETFENSIYTENLKKLGFNLGVTNMEQFDPNDYEDVKIPMEFKIYPVDIISNISTKFKKDYYDRFIKEAKNIFEKFNEKGECNPDNKLLYYETSECDNKLNIEHAHGGYICNESGYWDKNNCIAVYCDVGYILNKALNECIKDPCEDIILNKIDLHCNKKEEYIIEPNKAYIFNINIDNSSCTYTFYSKYDNFFFTYNEFKVLKPVKNCTEFNKKQKVYTNFHLNTTENIAITIKAKNENDKYHIFQRS